MRAAWLTLLFILAFSMVGCAPTAHKPAMPASQSAPATALAVAAADDDFEPPPKPASLPFAAEVELAQDTIKPGGTVQVRLHIVNRSVLPEDFDMQSTGWCAQWRSDNPRVNMVHWVSSRNVRQTHTLNPDESYEFEIPLSGNPQLVISESRPGKAVRFRMGFTPLGSKNTAWSEVMTVRIAEP